MSKALVLTYALQFIGTPYIWGGQSTLGIDCSGIVIELLKADDKFPAHGLDVTSQGIYLYLKDKGYKSTIFPAAHCIAFYGKSVNEIRHVAYCIDDRTIIEAAGGDSSTTTVEAARKRNAFVRLRPIGHRKDLIAILVEDNNVLPFPSPKK